MPTAPPRALPAVFTRVEALAAGYSRHQVQDRCTSGEWRRLSSGACCLAASWDGASADERYRLRVVAASLRWPRAVISHTSAAALWDLPMPPTAWVSGAPGAPLHERMWLTLPPGLRARWRSSGAVTVMVAALAPQDVEVRRSARYRRDVRVTSRARTVADCLRHVPAAAAVAFADAAGRAGTTRAEVLEVLGRQARWPGAEAAGTSVALVDPRRETWLESVSAVGLVQHGLPLPEPQVQLRTPQGRLVARVDDWWPGRAVAGEADGWAKYRLGGLVTADDAERALRTEKRREDEARALGVGFTRWSSGDVMTPQRLQETAAAVRRALELGNPSRLAAVVEPTPLPHGW